MINKKMALLGAAATLGVMGGAFLAPAHAVTIANPAKLSVWKGNTINDAGLDYFLNDYTGPSAYLSTWGNYTAAISNNLPDNLDFNVNVSRGTALQLNGNRPGTYTLSYSITAPDGRLNYLALSTDASTSAGNQVYTTTKVWSDNWGYLGGTSLLADLSTNPGGTVTQSFGSVSKVYVTSSFTITSGGGTNKYLNSITNPGAAAVPWETDALSVVGVTTLFGFGVWSKRKRKVDLSN